MNLIPKRKLSDTELNIRVAELRGWEQRPPDSNGLVWWKHPEHGWNKPKPRFGPYSLSDVPKYCNDLNAMHEVLTSLPGYDYFEVAKTGDSLWYKYELNLGACVGLRKNCTGPLRFLLQATARQRAEAFVLTN
jgi:hypothetical protein